MPLTLTNLQRPEWNGFDTIIDVRSPAEFAEDHIPGAISLPVLSDEERAKVGTIYTQDSPFVARKIGAALVARNAASHIETSLMGYGGGWQPLVYCWRGGQRSGSFSVILKQIGWRSETIEGGYQAYRRLVVRRLYEESLGLRVLRLDGNTGTAKTDILKRLKTMGVQIIDLEGLAGHRGSVLGDMPGGQPSQKAFESALCAEIATLDPARPLLVEAESSRIGALRMPPAIWSAMKDAPCVTVSAPLPQRAEYLASAYSDISDDTPKLAGLLGQLTKLVGHDVVQSWLVLLREGRLVDLAGELMTRHYDPAYARARKRNGGGLIAEFETPSLDAPALDALAERIAERVAQL